MNLFYIQNIYSNQLRFGKNIKDALCSELILMLCFWIQTDADETDGVATEK